MAHQTGVFKNNSWGRTRQPKNVASTHVTPAEVAVLAHNAMPNNTFTAGDVKPAADTGYSTENQRYLLVTVKAAAGNSPGRDLEVFAYSHATGVWASLTTLTTNNITANTAKTFQVDINGVDRVAFKRLVNTWTAAPDIFAACCTF